MTRIAILHPSDLLGEELKEGLQKRGLAGDLRLLSSDETQVGTLTDVGGAAAIVQRYAEGDLDGVDLAFFCGPIAANRPLLDTLPAATTGVVLSPDAAAGDGRPVVAGVNDSDVAAGSVMLSPHPAAVLLAHLLAPLVPLAPERAAATVIQPASLHGKEGLEELFDQTRSILAFSSERPETVFGRQLAFNHYPVVPARTDLGSLVRECLGGSLPLAARLLQGGSFHGLSASVFLRFADDPGVEAVREALAAHPVLELVDEVDPPAPIDVAAQPKILIGEIDSDPHEAGSYWLWAVMDNLTVGGALNALDIAAEALAQVPQG